MHNTRSDHDFSDFDPLAQREATGTGKFIEQRDQPQQQFVAGFCTAGRTVARGYAAPPPTLKTTFALQNQIQRAEENNVHRITLKCLRLRRKPRSFFLVLLAPTIGLKNQVPLSHASRDPPRITRASLLSFSITVRTPLPNISRHVITPIGTYTVRILIHGRRTARTQACCCWIYSCRIRFPRDTRVRRTAPRGLFPFQFGWEALAGPFRIGFCLIVTHPTLPGDRAGSISHHSNSEAL